MARVIGGIACKVDGCQFKASDGKGFCTDHVHLMPYASQIRAVLEGNFKNIDVESEQSREIFAYIHNGKYNLKEISKSLNLEKDIIMTYIRAFEYFGKIKKTKKRAPCAVVGRK